MDPASLALAEKSAPRYTSYPTAPHFSKSIGDGEARAWLANLDPSASLSLYFHVPFCTAICAYCGCHTKAVRQDAPPLIERVDYELIVDTDEDDARLELLHRNVRKYGTISNTVAA
ncbi:MAG: hypothetical protein Q8M72_06500, partial [Methylocystis sp.]|nr:hypothetical protein [Methylocystis sp.]